MEIDLELHASYKINLTLGFKAVDKKLLVLI